MKKRFVLSVEYGTGKMNMLTNNPDLIGALQEFICEYEKALPDAKMYGLPTISKAEILPLAYCREE